MSQPIGDTLACQTGPPKPASSHSYPVFTDNAIVTRSRLKTASNRGVRVSNANRPEHFTARACNVVMSPSRGIHVFSGSLPELPKIEERAAGGLLREIHSGGKKLVQDLIGDRGLDRTLEHAEHLARLVELHLYALGPD